MEDITLERLLSNFKGVLDEINEIVERKDIEQAREALNQIKELVYNEQNIPLDEGTSQEYDHVLHQLLSQISGVIETEREETTPILDETQVITTEIIEMEIIRVEEEIRRLRLVETTTQVNREEVLNTIERRTRRLELLRQELTRRNINPENEETTNLETEIADLEEQLQRAARARTEARNNGNESEEAIASAEYSRLVSEISTRRSRIAEIQNQSQPEQTQEESERSRLNTEIAELETQLQGAREALESGILSGQAYAERLADQRYIENQIQTRRNRLNELEQELNDEIERLNSEIEDLENQLNGAREALSSGNLSGQAYAERLADQRYLENQIQTRRYRLNQLENSIGENREGNQENSENPIGETTPIDSENNEVLDNLQAELERLERERISIENEYYRALEDNRGEENETTRQLYIELQRKTEEVTLFTKRIIAITTRTQEIEEDEENRNEGDRLDLGEQAKIIGDRIFKTAIIRRELQERDISREDFLEFYEAGRQRAHEEMARLRVNMEDIEHEIGTITNSSSGENLYDQLQNCDNIEDENERNSEKIRILEEIRRNFINNGQYEEELRNYGFWDEEITTIEQAERFNIDFFSKFERNAIIMLDRCKAEYDEQKENLDIYEQETKRIREEQRTIEIAQGNLESIEHEGEEEKALRERQIRATIFRRSRARKGME